MDVATRRVDTAIGAGRTTAMAPGTATVRAMIAIGEAGMAAAGMVTAEVEIGAPLAVYRF